jgi:hypothetical protein
MQCTLVVCTYAFKVNDKPICGETFVGRGKPLKWISATPRELVSVVARKDTFGLPKKMIPIVY